MNQNSTQTDFVNAFCLYRRCVRRRQYIRVRHPLKSSIMKKLYLIYMFKQNIIMMLNLIGPEFEYSDSALLSCYYYYVT